MPSQSTAGRPAGPTEPAGLQLERLPNGELAWPRVELEAAIRDADRLHQALTRLLDRGHDQLDRHDQRDRRYTIAEAGRDYLARERAMAALFGPWPTLAEACGAEQLGAA